MSNITEHKQHPQEQSKLFQPQKKSLIVTFLLKNVALEEERGL